MPTEEQLLLWKKELEQEKIDNSRLEGQQAELLRQLKEKFDCSSIEEAKKKLITMQSNLNKLQTQLEEETKEYEEKYLQ